MKKIKTATIRHPEFSPEYYTRSLRTLETALSTLSAYRPWQAFDPGKNSPIDERYAAMPPLTKKDIRYYFPDGFVPHGQDVKAGLASGEIAFVKTSGTVDVSVTNIWNQQWWDASERASWKLNSHTARLATGEHREALLANPMNVGTISDEVDLPLERRRLSRFLYLNEKTSPPRWTPAHMDRMITEINDFQPAILEANPSLLARLCRYIASKNANVFQPGLITLTYEFPTHLQHQQFRRVFTSPIASSYGTTETGYVFMQCEFGKFHQNSEFCRVDFQPLKKEHGGPNVGRILVTTFDNPWYYMVHFDVGDLGRIDISGKCRCGRNSGMILAAIEGRSAAVTLTTNGRLITQRKLDLALSVLEGIDEYRLEQFDGNTYDLQLVSPRKDKATLTEQVTPILKKLYGEDAQISVIYQDAIYPETSGKYRSACTRFPVDIERYLDT